MGEEHNVSRTLGETNQSADPIEMQGPFPIQLEPRESLMDSVSH